MDFKKESMYKDYKKSYKEINNKHFDYKDAMDLAIKALRLELKELMSNRYIGGHDNNADLIKYMSDSLERMDFERKTMSSHVSHHRRSLKKVATGKEELTRFENPIKSFSVDFVFDTITDKFSPKTWNAVMQAKNAFGSLKEELDIADVDYNLNITKPYWSSTSIEVEQLSDSISGFKGPSEGVSASSNEVIQQASTPLQQSCFCRSAICRANH